MNVFICIFLLVRGKTMKTFLQFLCWFSSLLPFFFYWNGVHYCEMQILNLGIFFKIKYLYLLHLNISKALKKAIQLHGWLSKRKFQSITSKIEYSMQSMRSLVTLCKYTFNQSLGLTIICLLLNFSQFSHQICRAFPQISLNLICLSTFPYRIVRF